MTQTRPFMVFTYFERFWHWTQAALIIALLLTGFDLHGIYDLWGFERASEIHVYCALSLMILWIFAIFWHLATGQWHQYVPTTKKLLVMLHYYAIGIFRNDPHPVKKTRTRKHNPLQALAYSALILLILPLTWISGVLYLLYSVWPRDFASLLSLNTVALVHTGAAFAMATFLIIHVYIATTGRTTFHHIKTMITGYDDEVEDSRP